VRIGVLDETPLAQHRDPVGERERLVLVVGDQQRGDVLALLDAPHLVAHRHASGRIERRERLVEQQRARLEGERAGERHALLLAAGELRGKPVAEPFEPDEREEIGGAASTLVDRRIAHAQRIGDVLPDAHVRKQRIRLEHDAALARTHGCRGHVLAPEADAARLGPEEAGDQLEQGRLAAAAGTNAHDELARLDLKAEVEDPRPAARVAEGDVLQGDCRHGAQPCTAATRVAPRADSAPPTEAASASASRITVAAQAKPVAP
jgi:hypothetical protein